MSEATSAPIMDNEHVKAFLSILQEHRPIDAQDFLATLRDVSAMERQLNAAVIELTAMRRELGEMREAQNHPVRTALQNAITALETKINDLRERLNTLKSGIIEGCKNAVAVFKEKGAAALNGIMNFFRVKDTLQNMRKDMIGAVKAAEMSIAKIEAVSTEYHEVGRHIKNIGRAMSGKELIEDAKPVGRIAKAAQAPQKLRKAVASGAVKGVDKAIGKLNRMEAKQAEKKPSILKNLNDLKEKAAQEKRDIPERPARQREASL